MTRSRIAVPVMETYGARCVASPSMETAYGRSVLAKRPDHPGSLGIAISEAVELAVQREDTKYALGSVLNHVLLHQTIIGLEAMEQMQMADTWPDVVVGCTGGGSNFAGIAFPFIGHGLRGGPKPRIVAVEPAACPSLTRGKYAYDFGDTGQHDATDQDAYAGQSVHATLAFMPVACATTAWHPMVSHCKELGCSKRFRTTRSSVLRLACCSRAPKASCPAPEANHAVKGAIAEAMRCKAEGKSETILFNLCGHGHLTWRPIRSILPAN
jgi:tryptophan synthase beta chain